MIQKNKEKKAVMVLQVILPTGFIIILPLLLIYTILFGGEEEISNG